MPAIRVTEVRTATTLVAVASGLVMMAAIPVAAAVPRCLGHPATIVGTDADDELRGTRGPDVIVGSAGWDTIDGGGGDDRICAGRDPDVIRGGAGDDRIVGGHGSDSAYGGRGKDTIRTGPGSVEALFGGAGDDRLFGGIGSYDGLIGGPGDDSMNGGPGLDIAFFFDARRGVEAYLETDVATGNGTDRIARIEGVGGSNFDDVLLGDDGPNFLSGQAGDDEIRAGGSGTLADLRSDLLDGGSGDDLLDGGSGGDVITFEDSPASVRVHLAAGTAEGWGADALLAIEAVIGSPGDDTLLGGDADESFAGGPGDDLIDGGAGIDEAAYFDAQEPVVADLVAGVAEGWGSDALVRVEDLTGSARGDELSGDGLVNRLQGGGGDDTLHGLAGADVLVGGEGLDAADGGEGVDACDAETEADCETDPLADSHGTMMLGSRPTPWIPVEALATGAPFGSEEVGRR